MKMQASTDLHAYCGGGFDLGTGANFDLDRGVLDAEIACQNLADRVEHALLVGFLAHPHMQGHDRTAFRQKPDMQMMDVLHSPE